ncbi:MAG: scavenger receptor cysteine-rich domain-containing protein [Candidatus Dadabacteria bacterium]|nr:scavenger receptor cysteine-rich domain-containing protein [Candidatus Dadabacteria bacterium]MDE0160058.1 scavenger receptor cysteine-rich domain-containing protein [Candidatus Dadabacteria bacterium]MDE0477873.1 scavenger receptor cysteine-rich domain-containing protein [Candidatus Dadabacteria bacterium]MDE0663042.1 scavenger receptor cysteine-rich domain-containing protein [Candidatus Dadabacteria bacterium]MYB27321.1 scavenger receptor cysteine-rich domain-containing protein [Candidatus
MKRFGTLKSSFWKKPEAVGGKRDAGTMNLQRVSIMVAGFALGLLLMGGPTDVRTQETYADGDLRLVDTDTGSVVDLSTATAPTGRLEIFDAGARDGEEWKGICDDGLGTLGSGDSYRVIGRQEAEVACRQLGFSGGEPRVGLALPKKEGGDLDPQEYYLLDELECSGSEDRILGEDRCKHWPRGHNNCSYGEAFGVTCEAATANNDAVGQIAVRGTEPKTGVLLTADHSKITDADGKPTDASAFSYQWIRSDIVWNETEISGATASTYTLQEADEENWIKVRISFTDNAGNSEVVESFEVGPIYTNKPDGSLRLIPFSTLNDDGTLSPSGEGEGLLQIFSGVDKRWKGVCDDSWDKTDADVACRQLGYAGSDEAIDQMIWLGYPPLLFLLDEVDCAGTESTLLECGHAGRGRHDCSSWEYAGVKCTVSGGTN